MLREGGAGFLVLDLQLGELRLLRASLADSSVKAMMVPSAGLRSSDATTSMGRIWLARRTRPVLPTLLAGFARTALTRSQVSGVESLVGVLHAEAESTRPAAIRAVASFFMGPSVVD
ncbi:hypothetical protein AHiyo4_46830 [Arthrobacter sp. Hiyo4]|nr:hypothetical protein AHiyo4_46830 [Arthrobacter sp. Hiyo4]